MWVLTRNRVQMSLIFFIYEGELTIYSDPLSYILTNILYRWWSIFLTPTHSSVSVFLFYALTFCRSHFLLKPNYPGNIFFLCQISGLLWSAGMMYLIQWFCLLASVCGTQVLDISILWIQKGWSSIFCFRGLREVCVFKFI